MMLIFVYNKLLNHNKMSSYLTMNLSYNSFGITLWYFVLISGPPIVPINITVYRRLNYVYFTWDQLYTNEDIVDRYSFTIMTDISKCEVVPTYVVNIHATTFNLTGQEENSHINAILTAHGQVGSKSEVNIKTSTLSSGK